MLSMKSIGATCARVVLEESHDFLRDRGHEVTIGTFVWVREFSQSALRRHSDYGRCAPLLFSFAMNKHVTLDEKLAALQESDTHRKWDSLDDRRVCILCEKVITGRMIDVWQDSHGVYRLHCPTLGCPGTPRDWFYHGGMGALRSKVIASKAPIVRFDLTRTLAP